MPRQTTAHEDAGFSFSLSIASNQYFQDVSDEDLYQGQFTFFGSTLCGPCGG